MNWIVVLALILLLLVLLAGLAAMVTFTNFQYQRTAIKEAWRHVDGHLQGRYDAIAALTRLVRQHAPTEGRVTGAVDELRHRAEQLSITEGTIPSTTRADTERDLTVAVRGLLSTGQAYPGLQDNRNFGAAQQALVQAQKQLSNNRKKYNQLVEAYNHNLDSNRGTRWVGGVFKFSPAVPFGSSEGATQQAPQPSAKQAPVREQTRAPQLSGGSPARPPQSPPVHSPASAGAQAPGVRKPEGSGKPLQHAGVRTGTASNPPRAFGRQPASARPGRG